MHRHAPVMLRQKVSDVIENLQHVTEAMKGEEADPAVTCFPGKQTSSPPQTYPRAPI